MIWLALLIPLFAVIVLAWKLPKRINIVEYLFVFGVPILCIVIGNAASIDGQTKDNEYWNSFVTGAVYEEEWREQWTELVAHTRTDSDGNTEIYTTLETERRTHPEKWVLHDNIGQAYAISRDYFESLCNLWDNKVFKDMQRTRRTSHIITKDGNANITTYDNVFAHMVPLCTVHKYENRLQASKSVFNFQKVSEESKKTYNLFDYPNENIFNFNPLLGENNNTAAENLQRYNGENGSKKQLHMFLLVFKNQPLEAGLFQESYWKGGNKNEFVVCVGITSNVIKWTRVISWTENEELKVRVAREIKEMEIFDAVKIVEYMGKNIPLGFVRKKFTDFNYLKIRPTSRAITTTYILTILMTVTISIFCIFNDVGYNERDSYKDQVRKILGL